MKKAASIVALLLTSTSAFAQSASDLKISGFADLRLTSIQYDESSGSNGYPDSGFSLEDGALYFEYKKDNVTFFLDAPFRRQKDSDRSGTATDTQSNGSNVLFGSDKAQIYGKISTELGVDVTLGQFDTIYGVEANDSKDRFFSVGGLIYEKFLPTVHMGAMATYSLQGAYVKAFAANPKGKGTLGTEATTKDENFEYGAAVGYSNEMYRGQIGYLSRGIRKANAVDNGQRALLDVTAGITWAGISFDLEYSSLADDSKNTLTSTVNTDSEDTATGMMALVTYGVTDALTVGVRYEAIANDPYLESTDKATATALGVSYTWSPAFQTKLDGIQYVITPVGSGTERTDKRFEIASVFRF
jgi:hypothetical protein